jgi:hypothetical protein
MTTLLDAPLRAKIERRARRAWRYKRRGESRQIHRITQVTNDTLLYRVPEPGDYYGSKKVEVHLEKNGDVRIEEPPEDPMLDIKSKTDLARLKKHNGPVRAYKYTDKDGKSPTQPTGKLNYEIGKTVEVKNASTNAADDCAAGVNLASLDWCQSSLHGDSRLFAVEFHSKDVAAIPTSSNGKFRVFRCKVVEELDPKDPTKVLSGSKPPQPKSPQDDLCEDDTAIQGEPSDSATAQIGEIDECLEGVDAPADEIEQTWKQIDETKGFLDRLLDRLRGGDPK